MAVKARAHNQTTNLTGIEQVRAAINRDLLGTGVIVLEGKVYRLPDYNTGVDENSGLDYTYRMILLTADKDDKKKSRLANFLGSLILIDDLDDVSEQKRGALACFSWYCQNKRAQSKILMPLLLQPLSLSFWS